MPEKAMLLKWTAAQGHPRHPLPRHINSPEKFNVPYHPVPKRYRPLRTSMEERATAAEKRTSVSGLKPYERRCSRQSIRRPKMSTPGTVQEVFFL